MWMRKYLLIMPILILTINFFYTSDFAGALNVGGDGSLQNLSYIDDQATSDDPERIKQAIKDYKDYVDYMENPELQWRLLRAYANYQSEQSERDPPRTDELKWAVEKGYEFAEKIDAANSERGEIVYYYASIYMRYLYFHKFKALLRVFSLKEPFEKAKSLSPKIDDAGPDRNLGAIYFIVPWFLGGSKEKALQHFEEAVNLAPQRAANRLWLAKVYAEEERYEDAREHINFILEGKFKVSSQHWHDIYMKGAEELAKTFP